jgi:hypothetical protein
MGKASLFFGILSVGLLACGGYRYVVDTAPLPEKASVDMDSPAACPLRVLDADRDVGEQPCADLRVRFYLLNTSDEPARIVGLAPCCRENCCMEAANMVPFVVPAGAEWEIECIAHAGKVGPFQCPLLINYYDRGRYRELVLSVHGTWVQPSKVLPRPREVGSR